MRYPWGNSITHADANYGSDDRPAHPCQGELSGKEGPDQWFFTSPAASFPANGFRLYDVAGNVFEWVQDWYQEDYYAVSPGVDPPGASSGSQKILRGGSWSSRSPWLAVDRRVRDNPSARSIYVGFRCAVEAFPGQ